MMRLRLQRRGHPQPGHAAGTTNWHGVGYDFLRNTRLNANDYFLNQSGTPRPVMQQNQFGGSLGGPIPRVRDTFFFVNYEGMRQKNGVTGTVNGNQPVLPTARDNASLAAAFGLPASSIDPVALNILNAKGLYGGTSFRAAAARRWAPWAPTGSRNR